MMTSTIIISIALAISLALNVIMAWYSRRMTTKLSFIYDNIGDVSELIANYQVHLKSVYSMEMFYGDETLKFLMDHTRSINVILEDYKDPDFFIDEFVEEDAPQQEETTDGETQIQEKDVFYAGTRRRNS
jgi:hypothetical protein